MHPIPSLPPTSAAATADALAGRSRVERAGSTRGPTPVPTEALAATWRLAYLVTGDRALAHRVVDELIASGITDLTRLRTAVLVRIRAEQRSAAGARRREALWAALQRLPRRDRAAIVARLRS